MISLICGIYIIMQMNLFIEQKHMHRHVNQTRFPKEKQGDGIN